MRAHLSHIDRAIARLLDERARLAAEMASGGASGAAVDPLTSDLLRRGDGDFPADVLAEVFERVAAGCRRAGEGARP